ncbi:MAG: polymerase sigma-B factor [Solirubrobacteraceae bacterium]|nr:polymerase sigma-B factor [Solirubrobacteraceae bacterium]
MEASTVPISVARTRTSVLARQQRSREDRRLFRAWLDHGDERARAALIERFLPLARSLANRYHRSGEPLDDLVQVASVALVKAIDRYDPARGCAFTSFAVPTICGELKRHFRDHTWTVRPPREIQELALRVDAARHRLWQKLDRSPTTSELARAMGVDDEQILEAMQASNGRGSLSLQGSSGDRVDAGRLEDTMGIEDLGLARAEMRADVDGLLATIAPRARQMVRLRFAADMSQAEIGALFGVSQMQVSRILRVALTRLRCVAEHRQLGTGA